MRTRITLIICLCLFAVGRTSAQWAVIDPSNIAQSIVNTSKNMVHTSTTAQNMIISVILVLMLLWILVDFIIYCLPIGWSGFGFTRT